MKVISDLFLCHLMLIQEALLYLKSDFEDQLKLLNDCHEKGEFPDDVYKARCDVLNVKIERCSNMINLLWK